MRRTLRVPLILFVLVMFLIVSDVPARASIPTGTQVVLIFVAVGIVGAAIGVGIYYAARKSPSLTGCTAMGADGLTLQSESDQTTFLLIGDVAGIKAGDRVRVIGKKKKDSAGTRTFLVDHLRKDFGACKVAGTP